MPGDLLPWSRVAQSSCEGSIRKQLFEVACAVGDGMVR